MVPYSETENTRGQIRFAKKDNDCDFWHIELGVPERYPSIIVSHMVEHVVWNPEKMFHLKIHIWELKSYK